MSNKQALREFQSRLAMRLQAAQAVGVAASWLAVEAGAQRLLFPLRRSGRGGRSSQRHCRPRGARIPSGRGLGGDALLGHLILQLGDPLAGVLTAFF